MDNNNNANNTPNSPNNRPKGSPSKFRLDWLFLFIAISLAGLFFTRDMYTTKNVGWTEFEQYLIAGDFEKITVYTDADRLEANVKKNAIEKIFKEDASNVRSNPKISVNIPSSAKFYDYIEKVKAEHELKLDVIYEKGESTFMRMLWFFGPVLLLVGLWFFMMRRMAGGGVGGGVFSVGKSKAQLFDKDSKVKIT
ncbi:MAG: ATP-dependent metallopeptidase FtsH/Yme1/Tma family protein, partial [Bacteroidales bacterium]|nr:ATP-dependent metallopeptidase FtsH/Yme1/Tma family protein [Bacteroidales bacterium]